MTQKLYALTVLICLSITATYAQYDIFGKVLDEKGAGVFYANVGLYTIADSTLITGNATDEDGSYTISNVKPGKYYVAASMIGYQDTWSEPIAITDQNVSIPSLNLKSDSQLLSEVEIKARKPLLEQRADRLVVNVSENIASANGSLMDVMRKVPGMVVVNDKLSLAGQQNVTILLNGRTTKYMDVQSLLRDLPGDNIKSVEIIHQPGAEFEASGSGPIINIITKKNSLFGTNGTISAGIGHTNDWKYNTGLRLSHYQGNVNIQGSVSYSQNSWLDELHILRRLPTANGTVLYDQINKSPSKSKTLRGSTSIDWDISNGHRIGLGARAADSNNDFIQTNKTVISLGDEKGTLNTDNARTGGWDMAAINPYYQWEIDTSGQKIKLDANWVNFGITRKNTLSNTATDPDYLEPNRVNDQNGDNNIFTTQIDYGKPFSKAIVLKLGAKYSHADLDNDLKVSDESNGVFVINPAQSNRFQFDEKVQAVYGKAEYKFGDLTGTLGLRYENSDSEGYSVTLDSTLSRNISQLFPSASISYPLVGPLAANLAYSYRIDRPRYSSLNPFVYYYDPFTSERGNPNLRPELTHSYKFSLSYEGQPFFNIEYKRSKDNMVEVTEQNDATGEVSRLMVNLERFSNFNTSLFLPWDMFMPFGGYIGGILNHNNYDSQYLGQQFDQDAWSFTGFASINFSLPWEISTEVSAWYNSGGQEGIINTEWLYGTGLSFSKKLLDNKLRLSLGVEDVVNRFFHGNIRYANMNADILNTWPNKVVNFRASYKFGNQHMKSKKHRSSANEEINRVKTN